MYPWKISRPCWKVSGNITDKTEGFLCSNRRNSLGWLNSPITDFRSMKRLNFRTDFALHNLLLFFFIIVLICFTILVPETLSSKILNTLLFSLMLLAASNAVRKRRLSLLFMALVIMVIRALSQFVFHGKFFFSFSTVISALFFLHVVYQLIFQVARSKKVTRVVILEAVNAYLLLGVCGAVLFLMLSRIAPDAFSLAGSGNLTFSDFMYFSYITLTTIGYGEILPTSDLARLISVMLGISGQLYIAIIISMLVGKFLSNEKL